MSGLIERQVIVTWYTPKEKLPPEDTSVLVTVSGRRGSCLYDRALMIGEFSQDEGWFLDIGEFDALTVHAWADIEPYGFKGGKDME